MNKDETAFPVTSPMCHLSVPTHPHNYETKRETAIAFHVINALAAVLTTVSCCVSSLAVLPALLPALSFH